MRKLIIALILVSGLSSVLYPQTLSFTKKKNDAVSVSPGAIAAFGKLGDMTEIGSGATLSYIHYNLFFSDLFAGVQSGFYRFPGKSTSDNAPGRVDDIIMVPALANIGYKFHFTHNFSISPSFSIGTSCFDASYSPNSSDETENDFNGGDSKFAEFDMKAGINMIYVFNSGFYTGLSSDIGVFIEKDYGSIYAQWNATLGFRF